MPASTSQRRTKPKVRRNSDVIFDDSWESQDDSTHFTVNGSFSIRDGKLSVTIDDED